MSVYQSGQVAVFISLQFEIFKNFPLSGRMPNFFDMLLSLPPQTVKSFFIPLQIFCPSEAVILGPCHL